MARPMFVVPVVVKVERCASGHCTALVYRDELNLHRTHRVVIWGGVQAVLSVSGTMCTAITNIVASMRCQ